MRLILSALIYLSATLGAIAGPSEIATGDMRKLVFHSTPRPVSEETFTSADGQPMQLSDLAGQITVVNFWATWCPPCRKEMPSLDALNQAMGDDLAVVTIGTMRSQPTAMKRVFEELNIETLPLHQDKGALARSMGILGLPVTVILDANGQEIARMQGDADWNSENAQAVLKTVLANH